MKIHHKIMSAILVAMILSGCSSKSNKAYNLPPNVWYDKIMKDIKSNDLKAADSKYAQFSSEHIASPLLENTLLILAIAHMQEDDYILANSFLNEYIRKFGTRDKIEYAQFLKIKANYDSFKQPNRNQNLMQNSIIEINNFLIQYPKTQYRPLLETMLIKFKLALYHLNEDIANLYERTNRDISAEIYRKKLENSSLSDANLVPPDLPWYRKFFE
ncbi:outer membrane protein assembly factor BamD [Campylobacter sp. FMV-PI01]|uniref:Outer membrane protein assembly factor BamD n=1 Tax=Campylobacter portucalensis TaxID=2608384 RepID=A0A6L5WJP6_9BACT|nr:outer membrane protein assembly factor BamD [Campylobacter portucalensis]MSN97166.1 outer membrane protein assembly factor BamD [Campylobacter portucalensis]